MQDILEMLDNINQTTIRTNNRLKSIIIPSDCDNTMNICSDIIEKPINVKTLIDNNDIQVMTATIKAGTTCVKHKHIASVEYFFVVSGVLKICGKTYNTGEMATIPKNTNHLPSAPESDCMVIVMLMPPEPAYHN